MDITDPTEQKRVKAAAQALEHQLETCFESAGDAIYILEAANGRILKCNARACLDLGYSRDELLKLSAADIETSLALEEIAAIHQKIKTGTITTVEGIHKRNDGTLFPVEIRLSSLAPFQPELLLAIVRDITKRKKAEEKMRESEMRYRKLFEASGDAIFILDAEGENAGRIISANAAAAKMHGYTLEEILALNITDLDTPEAGLETPTRMRRILNGEWINEEITHRKKDGAVFPVEISAGLLELGERRYVLALDRDITERKKTEAALQKSEAFIKGILESVDEGFVVIDRDYRVISANRAFTEQTGMALEEMIGRHCFEISHHCIAPCYEEGEICAVKYVFDTGEAHTVVHMHHDKKGAPVYVETKAYPLAKDEAGKVITVIEILVDITAKRKAEDSALAAAREWSATFDTINDAITIHDADFNILRSNKAAESLLGIAMSDILTNKCFKSYHGRGCPPEGCPSCQTLKTGVPSTVELFEPHLNKYIEIKAMPRFDDDHNIIGVVHVVRDITEQKRTINDLIKSEELYRSLFKNMLNGFAYCRMLFEEGIPQDFIYLAVNDAFETQTGLKDVVGRKVSEVIPGIREADPQLFEIYGRVAMTGQPERFEVFLKALQMWFSMSVYSPVREHVVAVFDVITARKNSEKVLQKSEEKFRNLFNNAEVGMFRSRLDGSEVLDVNQKFLDIVGRTLEETLGKPSEILWADPNEREEMARRLVAEGRVSEFEHTMLNKQGDVRNCITSLVLYREQDILEGSILDITERKKIEKALKESEERFRSAFEHAAIGFSIYSTDGHFLRVNQALCGMLGYSAEELMTKTFQDITHPDDRGLNMDQINQLLSGKLDVLHFQKRYIHKLGHEIWASLSVSVVRNDKGSPMYLISLIEDLTEKKKLEEQLRHAQKMEAVGTLAGGIAHDFNNILNVILGFGTMVMDRIADDPVSKEQMKEVLDAGDRAAELTKKLLIFSRKQVVEVKPIDINDLIPGLKKMLGRIIRENIDFKLELSGRPLMALADAGQIEQVLMNLVANARDAMPEGGRLTICTEIKELDEEYVAAYGYGKPGSYALITVADTGQGMDEETKEKIFEPFFTTKGIGEGTGLGLAISYGIIKQHNGYIKVYSELGKGTEFKIYLPLIEDSAGVEIKTDPLAAVKGGNETILLAEDDAVLRKLSKIVLESHGYNVIISEDGEDAITKFMENREKISLCLIDMIMPKKNGKEVAEEIGKVSPRTKLLFMSGYTMDIITTRELTEDGFDFILKPVLPRDLLIKVREILDR